MRLPALRAAVLTAALTAAFATLTAAPVALAQGFGDLSDADRAALHAEIRAYLLEYPEVLREAIEVLEERDAQAQARSDETRVSDNAEALFSDGYSWVGGNPDGDITIVEFLDYQCSFCKRAHPEVTAMIADDANIRLIVKELPVLGPASVVASRTAMAALDAHGGEVYHALFDKMMRHEGRLTPEVIATLAEEAGADMAAVLARAESPEITARLEANRGLAAAMDVNGTPTFVIGDQIVRGYLPRAQMEALLAELRKAP